MAREVLNNGEVGFDFRTKLNANFEELYDGAGGGASGSEYEPTYSLAYDFKADLDALYPNLLDLGNQYMPLKGAIFAAEDEYKGFFFGVNGTTPVATRVNLLTKTLTDIPLTIGPILSPLFAENIQRIRVLVDSGTNTTTAIFPAPDSTPNDYPVSYVIINNTNDTVIHQGITDINTVGLSSLSILGYFPSLGELVMCWKAEFLRVDAATGATVEHVLAPAAESSINDDLLINQAQTNSGSATNFLVPYASRRHGSPVNTGFLTTTQVDVFSLTGTTATAPTATKVTLDLVELFGSLPWYTHTTTTRGCGIGDVSVIVVENNGTTFKALVACKFASYINSELTFILTGVTLAEFNITTGAIVSSVPLYNNGLKAGLFFPVVASYTPGEKIVLTNEQGFASADYLHPGMAFNNDGYNDLSDVQDRVYQSLIAAGDYALSYLSHPANELVLFDTANKKYYAMDITVWGSGGSGGVTYTRQEIDTQTGALIGPVITHNQATSGDGTLDFVGPGVAITRPAGGGGLINVFTQVDGSGYKFDNTTLVSFNNDITTFDAVTGETLEQDYAPRGVVPPALILGEKFCANTRLFLKDSAFPRRAPKTLVTHELYYDTVPTAVEDYLTRHGGVFIGSPYFSGMDQRLKVQRYFDKVSVPVLHVGTTAEVAALAPRAAELVYDTETNVLSYYDGTALQTLVAPSTTTSLEPHTTATRNALTPFVGQTVFNTDQQKGQVYVSDTGLAAGGASNATPGWYDMY